MTAFGTRWVFMNDRSRLNAKTHIRPITFYLGTEKPRSNRGFSVPLLPLYFFV